MTPAQQELFDRAILRVLDTNRTRYGLPADTLGHQLPQFGFDIRDRTETDNDYLLDRVDYLVRKGLVEEVTKLVGKANRAWRITPAGINHVDERG